MALGYDIFKKLGDGSPLWIGQIATFDEAKTKVEALVRTTPAEYFIREASTGQVVFRLCPPPAA